MSGLVIKGGGYGSPVEVNIMSKKQMKKAA